MWPISESRESVWLWKQFWVHGGSQVAQVNRLFQFLPRHASSGKRAVERGCCANYRCGLKESGRQEEDVSDSSNSTSAVYSAGLMTSPGSSSVNKKVKLSYVVSHD